MKRILSLFIAAIIMIFALPSVYSATVAASGSCGNNVTWSLSSDGTLTISGTGEMTDYSYGGWPWESRKTQIKKIIINDGVKYLGYAAFAFLDNLVEVQVPGSVKMMGSYVFWKSPSLSKVTLGEGLPFIGSAMFADCPSLKSIIIPKSVTYLVSGAFSKCTSLTDISLNNNVTDIAIRAFENCTSLKNITGVDNVTSIGQDAFKGTAFDLGLPNGENYIGKVFYKYAGTVPNETRIVFKSGTTAIAASAFAEQKGLVSVDFGSSIKEIGRAAFFGCTGLTEIKLPDSLEKLGDGVFAECNSVTSVTLGKNLTNLPDYIFQKTKISEITIPDKVEKISPLAFFNCNNLTKISVSAGNKNFIAEDALLYNKDKTKLILCLFTATQAKIASTVKEIGENAFLDCKKITELEIPDGVITIGDWAFARSSLVNITLPDSVTAIGRGIFNDCKDLETVHMGNGITELPYLTFENCRKLAVVTLPQNLESIELRAFTRCAGLISLTIPKSVTSISREAFLYCDFSKTELTILNPHLKRQANGSYMVLDSVLIDGTRLYSNVQGVFDLVNEERKKQGLSALILDEELTEAAMLRAAEASIDFNHDRPNGTSFSSVLFTNAKRAQGENLAAYSQTPEGVMKMWMGSTAHRTNILLADMNIIGIGCFKHEAGGIFWVQLFGRDLGGESGELKKIPSDSVISEKISINDDYDINVSLGTVKSPIKIGSVLTLSSNIKKPEWSTSRKVNNKSFTFSSSNPKVAAIDSSGRLTAISEGNVTITVTTSIGREILLKIRVVTTLIGDINNDDAITIHDALEILKQLAGLPSVASANITIMDALEILKYLAGLPNSLDGSSDIVEEVTTVTTTTAATTAATTTTTTPLEITTLAPETTTVAPETTTLAPETTTSPPEITTSASETTTSPPQSVSVGEVIQFAGYGWRVLAIQDDKALILSEKILAARQYHSNRNIDVTWENSDIRGWLNGDFCNETFTEKERIQIAELTLLSIDEVERYLINGTSTSWWWTRSQGSGGNRAALVRANGSIDSAGNHVDNNNGGIRPAMWLYL